MPETSLRLATWNIHMAIGRDGRRDLDRTAEVIRSLKPDVIGLQEVDNRVSGHESDLDILSDLTKLAHISGPTMLRTNGDYGNALLTKLPVLDVERHELSVEKREPRGLLVAHLDWRGERLQVAVTHLGLHPGERRTQVRKLIACLSATDRTPLILMGDFNEWLFWGRPLRWLHHHFGRVPTPPTFPARWPLLRLDHILSVPRDRLQGLRVVKKTQARNASDHLPLVATYQC